jgi:P-type Cu+ transporter
LEHRWRCTQRFERLRQRGILLSRIADIETMAKVNRVVFDKTGTLSPASGCLTSIRWKPGHADNAPELLAMLGAAEDGLHHPFAEALRQAADWDTRSAAYISPGISRHANDVTSWKRTELQILAGLGIRATVSKGERQHVVEVLRASSAGLAVHAENAHDDEPAVTIHIDGLPVADACFDESLFPERDETWRQFERDGIQLQLLTGDSAARAARTGIAETRAALAPLAKAEEVQRARERGATVLFVGDGLNDAAAMAVADVALALTHGAPLAREVASGTWDGRDLHAIPEGLRICRETMQRVRVNFIWALSYNVAGMGLAAAGQLHPVVAALLMTASSALITWRSLALLDIASPAELPAEGGLDGNNLKKAESTYA